MFPKKHITGTCFLNSLFPPSPQAKSPRRLHLPRMDPETPRLKLQWMDRFKTKTLQEWVKNSVVIIIDLEAWGLDIEAWYRITRNRNEKKQILSIIHHTGCLIRNLRMLFLNNPYITGYYNPLYTLNNQGPSFNCSSGTINPLSLVITTTHQASQLFSPREKCSAISRDCIPKIVKGQEIRRTLEQLNQPTVELFDTPQKMKHEVRAKTGKAFCGGL